MRKFIIWAVVVIILLFVADYFISKAIEEAGGVRGLFITLLIGAGIYSLMNE